jgi:non-specific serine/threonine protein kinase
MRDTIAWSYDLLAADEQALFRRLAVFSGGFTFETIQAISDQEPGIDILPSFTRLVEHSLVRRDEGENAPRYRLLETVREFAWEQLRACCEDQRVSQDHASYYLAFAEHAAPELYGSQQLRWLAELEREHPNLRSALAWFQAQGDAEAMLRLAAALWRFWFIRGYPREGRAWLARALAVSHPWSPALREALNGACMMAGNQGDHLEATALAERLLTLAREQGDPEAVARALHLLSYAATYRHDRDQARTLARQALAIARELDDPQSFPDHLNRLGIEEHIAGDYARAAALYAEAQSIWRGLGCTWELVVVTTNLGVTAQAQGEITRAAIHYHESLMLLQEVGETWMIEELLALVAAVAAESGDPERAARLIGATDRLIEAIGFALVPFVAVFYEQARASLQRNLAADAVASAQEAGRQMTRTQALNEAFAVVSMLADAAKRPPASTSLGLSPREMEVLRLLVEGRSDRQIAAALFISAKTAGNHVSRILAKLGVDTPDGRRHLRDPPRSRLTGHGTRRSSRIGNFPQRLRPSTSRELKKPPDARAG